MTESIDRFVFGLVFVLFGMSNVYASNCSEEAKQMLGQDNVSSISPVTSLSKLTQKIICNNDYIIEIIKKTPSYDGSIDFELKILNVGEADGVLEIFSPKGVSDRITDRYFVPGKRSFPKKLSRLLNVNLLTQESSLSTKENNLFASKWTLLKFRLPFNGSVILHKNTDLALSVSLVRIALENIIITNPDFYISLEEFWDISQRVGINAAKMLSKHVINDHQATWTEGVDTSIAVINGLIMSLSQLNNTAVSSAINGAYQLNPDDLYSVLEILGWASKESASYNFEETINDLKRGASRLIVKNDYEIPKTDIPMSLMGSWEGKVLVYPNKISSSLSSAKSLYTSFKLEIDPINNVYVTNYPELDCMGILTFEQQGINSSTYRFKERLVRISPKCRDGGYVNLISMFGPNPKSIMFYWENPETSEKGIGGSIKRVAKTPDKIFIKRAMDFKQYDEPIDQVQQTNEERAATGGVESPSEPRRDSDLGPYCGLGNLQKLLIPEYACYGLGRVLPYAVCAAGTPVGYKTVYFGVACKEHDACYSQKGETKSACDNKFLSLLTATCDERLQGEFRKVGRANCHNTASEYYHQVKTRGCLAFKEAQLVAGNMDPTCETGSASGINEPIDQVQQTYEERVRAEALVAANLMTSLVSKGLLTEKLYSNLKMIFKAIKLAKEFNEVQYLIDIANAAGLSGTSIAYLQDRIITDGSIMLLESLVNIVIDQYYPENTNLPPKSIAKLWIGLAIDGVQGDIGDIVMDPLFLIAEEMASLEKTTTRLEQAFIDGAVSNVLLLQKGSSRYDIVESYMDLAQETVNSLQEGWWDWPSETDAARKIEIVQTLLQYRASQISPSNFTSMSMEQIGSLVLEMESRTIQESGGIYISKRDTVYREFANSVARALGIDGWTPLAAEIIADRIGSGRGSGSDNRTRMTTLRHGFAFYGP